MNFEEIKKSVVKQSVWTEYKKYDVGVIVGSHQFDDEDAVGYYIEGYGTTHKGDIVLFANQRDISNYHTYSNDYIRESWSLSPYVQFRYLEAKLETSLPIGTRWIGYENMFAFINNKKCEIKNVRLDKKLKVIVLEVEDEFESSEN